MTRTVHFPVLVVSLPWLASTFRVQEPGTDSDSMSSYKCIPGEEGKLLFTYPSFPQGGKSFSKEFFFLVDFSSRPIIKNKMFKSFIFFIFFVIHLSFSDRSVFKSSVLENKMATYSSILAWRIPWMEEPGRLQSTGSQRVGHDWVT